MDNLVEGNLILYIKKCYIPIFFKGWNLSLCVPKSFCTGGKKFVQVYISYQNDS